MLAKVPSLDADTTEWYDFEAGKATPEPSILLAEDDLPWHENPLQHAPHQAYCLEIPLKTKDVRAWLREDHDEGLAHIAAAGKKARVEVRLKDLSPEELKLFDLAKSKELTCGCKRAQFDGFSVPD